MLITGCRHDIGGHLAVPVTRNSPPPCFFEDGIPESFLEKLKAVEFRYIYVVTSATFAGATHKWYVLLHFVAASMPADTLLREDVRTWTTGTPQCAVRAFHDPRDAWLFWAYHCLRGRIVGPVSANSLLGPVKALARLNVDGAARSRLFYDDFVDHLELRTFAISVHRLADNVVTTRFVIPADTNAWDIALPHPNDVGTLLGANVVRHNRPNAALSSL